jgi:hypothetical protein
MTSSTFCIVSSITYQDLTSKMWHKQCAMLSNVLQMRIFLSVNCKSYTVKGFFNEPVTMLAGNGEVTH